MITDRYVKFYGKISQGRKRLLKIFSAINKAAGPAEKEILAGIALKMACTNTAGIYLAKVIEDVYLGVAQRAKVELAEISFTPRSFLHVMTEAYLTGGHTRVVERWIDQSDSGELHSLVILEQSSKDTIPPALIQNVKTKHGECFFYDGKESQLSRALALRKLAMGYEYVVLHVHMDDPIPIMAFGCTEFTRPVIFFNHADHAFWCGVSIADMVAELGSKGKERSLLKRGVAKSEILGIPADHSFQSFQYKSLGKDEARKKLGLPAHKKIILTLGSSHKFNTLAADSLPRVLRDFLCDEPDVVCYAIGPNPQEDSWREALEAFPSKLVVLPKVDYDKEYFEYLLAADLVLDSYPISGGTTMVDAVMFEKPVLSLFTPMYQSDYLLNSDSYCKTEEEFLHKMKKVLHEPDYTKILARSTHENFLHEHSVENWLKRKEKLIANTPKVHSINQMASCAGKLPEIGDEEVLVAFWENKDLFKLSFRKFSRSIRHAFFKKLSSRNYSGYKLLGRYIRCRSRIEKQSR